MAAGWAWTGRAPQLHLHSDIRRLRRRLQDVDVAPDGEAVIHQILRRLLQLLPPDEAREAVGILRALELSCEAPAVVGYHLRLRLGLLLLLPHSATAVVGDDRGWTGPWRWRRRRRSERAWGRRRCSRRLYVRCRWGSRRCTRYDQLPRTRTTWHANQWSAAASPPSSHWSWACGIRCLQPWWWMRRRRRRRRHRHRTSWLMMLTGDYIYDRCRSACVYTPNLD